MADDMLIGVGVKADFSSLKSEAKASADALKQAEAAWKEAFAQLGQAAQQGSVQAQEALKQYENELSQTQARAAFAGQAMAEAQASAGAAATHSVPQFAAASGALRELQGNFDHNIRAAERFLSTSLGLGPILQAAFPLVGALAFGGVLFEIGKSLAKFGSDASALGRELGVGWLDAAIGQLTGLGKAVEEADKQIETLNRDIDSDHKKQEKNEVQITTLVKGRAAGLRVEASQIQSDIDKISSQLTNAEGRLKADRKSGEIRVNEFGSKVTDNPNGMTGALEAQANAKSDEKQLTSLNESLKTLRGNLAATNIRADQAEKEEQEKRVREAQAAAARLLEADRAALVQVKLQHTLTVQEEIAYWQKRAEAFKNYPAQFDAVQREILKLTQDGARKEAEARKQVAEGAIADAREKERQERIDETIHDAVTKTLEDQFRAQEEEAISATRSADAQIEAAAKVAEARVQYQLSTGVIDEQAAAHQLAAIKAQAYADQIRALREELQKLESIDQAGGNTKKRQQDDRTKITELGGNHDATLIQGAARSATAFEKPWVRAFETITRQWQRVQDQVLMGQMSIGQGAVRMLQELELNWLRTMENMLLSDIQMAAKRTLAHKAGNTEIVASDATTAAAGDTIHKTSALKGIFIDAKSAAASAYKGAMTLPPPANFILAPIAAAGAFAGVMALAAFEKGGIVGGAIGSAVPIVAHAGERVLDVAQTRNFETLVSNSSQARSTTVNARVNQYFPNAGAASSARSTRASVQGLARRGKLAIG